MFGLFKQEEKEDLMCINCAFDGPENLFYRLQEYSYFDSQYKCPECNSRKVYPKSVAGAEYAKLQIEKEKGPVPPK